MHCFKFSLYLSLLVFSNCIYAFSQKDCLEANFGTTIKHKGHPFGLVENVLVVDKKYCVIDIYHRKLKFLNSQWQIDVCRAPVHIKEGTGAVEVIKRGNGCTKDNSHTDFCSSLKKIMEIFQDDGLIFAEGEKEQLNSDHGKIYCAYKLIQSYLGEGSVLSRYGNSSTKMLPPEEKKGLSPTGSF